MKSVAYGLIGAAKLAGNRGGGLAFGAGEADLAAPYGTGGRGPETGFQGRPCVRRERAYK